MPSIWDLLRRKTPAEQCEYDWNDIKENIIIGHELEERLGYESFGRKMNYREQYMMYTVAQQIVKEYEERSEIAIKIVSRAIAEYRNKTGNTPTGMVLSKSFSRRVDKEFYAYKVQEPSHHSVLLGIPVTVDELATLPVVMS